ncbi:universal stress protein UspE [Colwellia psychrerythraea]|uniref:Universal stress protein family n=1 Tax=Colwellia psychrerythraea (strain 34H / ATCC BAA-681) TaxID=167879 RepID=Q483Q0_COLP3|nr:universal stress protein UspE [Colwellia psychrerythraea]AAZ28705.1 universal stress protein family [Colwellia psychrerythraea 34H]
MDMYQNILVVIDPTTDEQKALKRVIDLASRINTAAPDQQTNITAFFSIFDFSYEMTTILSSGERDTMRQMVIKEKQKWLDDIIALSNSPITITSKVVWHNRPFEAIINQVIEHKYDLVVKGTHQHDKFKSVVFTPTDWHILRKCPCPVLLVKEHEWPEQGNILAAVNVGSDEAEHISLNEAITTQAKNIAQLITADVHLVNSFPGTPVNIAIEIPEFDASEYNSAMQAHHKEAMSKHANSFDIPLSNTYVEEGLPEAVIEQAALKIDAELVILGTIGRTGISAALIGNTAEHVIDQLDCDVLALKPDGYISPLDVE